MPRKTIQKNLAYDTERQLYYAVFRQDGRRYTRTYRTREEAQAALEGNSCADRRLPGKDCTLGEWLTFWLEEVVARDRAESTLYAYRNMARCHVLPALGRIPLAELTPLRIQGYLYEKMNQGLSPNTVIKHYVMLTTALGMAVRLEMLERSPMDRVTPPKKKEARFSFYSPEQLQLLRGVKAEAGLLLLGRRHPVHGAAFQHLQPHRHAQGRGQHHIVLDDRVGGQALVHLLIEIALDTQGRQLRQRDPSQGRQHMTACHVAVGVQRALRPVPGHHLLQPEGQPLPQCAVLPRQAPVGTGVPLQRGLGLLPGAVGAGIAPSVLPEHRVIQLPLRVVCKILLDRLSGHGCIPLSFSLVLRCRRIAKGPCAADHGAA